MFSFIPRDVRICACYLFPVEGARCIGNAPSSDNSWPPEALGQWSSGQRASFPRGARPGGDDRCDMLFLRSSMSLFRGCRLWCEADSVKRPPMLRIKGCADGYGTPQWGVHKLKHPVLFIIMSKTHIASTQTTKGSRRLYKYIFRKYIGLPCQTDIPIYIYSRP